MDYKFPIAIENLLPVDIARIINCQLFQKEQFDEVINEINTIEDIIDLKECIDDDDVEDEYIIVFDYLKEYKKPEYIYNRILFESCYLEDTIMRDTDTDISSDEYSD